MRGHLLPVATLLAVAAAARMLQLLLSSLPLNIDSFAQVAIAEEVLRQGAWRLDEASMNAYNLKMPVLPLLLGLASALTGVVPLELATPLILAISLAGILGVYALALRITRHRSLAVVAGLVPALLGPYVFLTGSVMKEALGLALLPVLLLLFLRRADPRRRGLAAFLLLLLPLIHHLTALMAGGLVGLLALLQAAQAYWRGRWSWRTLAADLLLGPALLGFGLWYYQAVGMAFFTSVWNPNDVALFLATATLVGTGGLLLASPRRARPWFALSKARRLPSLLDQKAVVIVGGVFLILANALRPLVPGTAATTLPLLLITIAYLPLALLALTGLNLHRLAPGPGKAVVVALLLAPLTPLVYALLRGLDPLSHVLIYRSLDFLDLGLAVAIGTAVVRSRWRRPLAGLLVASLLATLPLAYATEAVFQVQNTTFAYEMAAMRRVKPLGATPHTDQRMASILAWSFGVEADASLPLTLAEGGDVAPGALLLVEGDWATRGAQVHPLPFVVVDEAILARTREGAVVYHGGDAGNPLYLVIAGV